ncbi:profilin [Streptomyces caniferus]|uniref:profilin n=1 Tax=Streptomyces caniferus TaxID=285557 RepID=UPI002E2A0F3E|nr:profilin [Streptomyces caniferus]
MWQQYVDELVGTVSQAAILDHNGGILAKSPEIDIAQSEAAAILASFQDTTAIQRNGFSVDAQKYGTTQANGHSLYGANGGSSVLAVKTKHTVLVAVYKAPTNPGNAERAVRDLADQLINAGY